MILDFQPTWKGSFPNIFYHNSYSIVVLYQPYPWFALGLKHAALVLEWIPKDYRYILYATIRIRHAWSETIYQAHWSWNWQDFEFQILQGYEGTPWPKFALGWNCIRRGHPQIAHILCPSGKKIIENCETGIHFAKKVRTEAYRYNDTMSNSRIINIGL